MVISSWWGWSNSLLGLEEPRAAPAARREARINRPDMSTCAFFLHTRIFPWSGPSVPPYIFALSSSHQYDLLAATIRGVLKPVFGKKATDEADNTIRILLFKGLYTVHRDRPDQGNELMRVIEIIYTHRISSNLPLNVVFLCWLRFYFDARRILEENRGPILDFLSKIF